VKKPIRDAAIEIGISTYDGLRIVTATSIDRGGPVLSFTPGLWEVTVELPVTLQPGQYSIDMMMHHWSEKSKLTIDWVERVLTFTALDMPKSGPDHYVCFAMPYNTTSARGVVRAESIWHDPVAV